MSRSVLIAMVFGGLVAGAACKKNESSAKKETPKPQEGQTQPTDNKQTAAASPGAAAGVKAGGIQRDDNEGSAGIVTSVNGTVEIKRVGEPTWTAAKADAKLYAGDTLRTADNSTATITMADESVVEVAEVTTVGIASRNGTADPASGAAVLGGVARFTVTSRAPGEGPFRVYTSSGVIVTRGTTYGVGVAASGEARVGVESGAVEVIGLAQMDATPITVEKSTQVVIASEGNVGAPAAWPADDWGTWRDEAEANVKLDAALEAHARAMADFDKALADSYAELQANADAAATFEATAATTAEKNDTAAYQAAQAEGAATIDASFLLAARLETLTWAHASRAALATELYVRHPDEAKAKWEVVAPHVEAAVLWPKRYEITATAYFEPLRTQYYVHHPRGRAHAALVGIAVPAFYATVEPAEIEPAKVRAKLKGQVWIAPEMRYTASARAVWIAAPAATWHAKIKVKPAPARAKVAWYVRPATLKAKVLFGGQIKGDWKSKHDVAPPQPRASLAAMWTIPVGAKIKVAPPDMSAAATARSKVKLGANGMLVRDHRASMTTAGSVKGNVKGKVDATVGGKVDVKAPDVKGKVGVTVRDHRDTAGAAATGAAAGGVKVTGDAKTKVGGAVKAGGNAAGGAKGKVDGAVKAGASVDVKVKAPPPPPPPPPPSVKVEGKVKASGGFKLGN